MGGFILGATSPHDAADQEPAVIRVSRATVVGFFPPVSRSDFGSQEARSEALAHLRFALRDVSECLAALRPEVHLRVATALSLAIDGEVRTVSLPTDPDRSLGAYLIRPGAEPRAVYAGAGASSLSRSIPLAAGEYFDAPDCTEAAS